MAEIPQIMRDVPPEKFRELIDAVLGGPLQFSSLSIKNEIIDEPTDDDRMHPHTELPDGKIITNRSRSALRLNTDWHARTELSFEDKDHVRLMYVLATVNGRFKSRGVSVTGKERWSELVSSGNANKGIEITGSSVVKKVKMYGFKMAVLKAIEWFTED